MLQKKLEDGEKLTLLNSNQAFVAAQSENEIYIDFDFVTNVEYLSKENQWVRNEFIRIFGHELHHVVSSSESIDREEEAIDFMNDFMKDLAEHEDRNRDDAPQRLGHSYVRVLNDLSLDNPIAPYFDCDKVASILKNNPDPDEYRRVPELQRMIANLFKDELKHVRVLEERQGSILIQYKHLGGSAEYHELTDKGVYYYVDYEATHFARKALEMAPEGFSAKEIAELQQLSNQYRDNISNVNITEEEVSFDNKYMLLGTERTEEVTITKDSAIVR